MNVLIVDDDPQSVFDIQCVLRKRGYLTFTVDNTQDATTIIDYVEASVVIVDANMPGLPVLDFCQWVRKTQFNRYIHLLVIGYDPDPVAASRALDAGADDFMQHSTLSQELGIRIRSAERIVALERELAEKNQHLNSMFQRLTGEFMQVAGDMAMASRVQQDLLPSAKTFGSIDAHGFLRPAMFMAGDSYDYFMLGKDHLAFYIADVVGHGSTSAMVSYALHHQITPRAHSLCINNLLASKSPEEAVTNTVRDLNDQFCLEGEHNRWFTMIYGLIKLSTGEVTMCQAGQPPALHCKISSEQIDSIGTGGFPVGLFNDVEYTASHCQLNPGDKLLACSDGALECLSAEEKEFGHEQLCKVVLECSGKSLAQTADAINERLLQWNGSDAFADDVSVLLFEYAA